MQWQWQWQDRKNGILLDDVKVRVKYSAYNQRSSAGVESVREKERSSVQAVGRHSPTSSHRVSRNDFSYCSA
jgi:hypothetical protein